MAWPKMFFGNDSEKKKCPYCLWEGKLKDCDKEWYDDFATAPALCGRAGWKIRCPKCNFMIEGKWERMG